MRWTVWSVCGLAILAARPGAAQEATHVRAVDPVIGPLIARGIEHSPTFRELVAAIDASDSYVYVKEGACSPSVRSCLVAVTGTESARFVWVKVDVRAADAELISRIGHELRHALEVIDEPTVRDNGSMFFLYKRIGTHAAGSTIETKAAMAAARTIRKELRHSERPDPE
jgi:hypothetical protein